MGRGQDTCVRTRDWEDEGQKAVMEQAETSRQDGPAPCLCDAGCEPASAASDGARGPGMWSIVELHRGLPHPRVSDPPMSPRKPPAPPLTWGFFFRLTSCRSGRLSYRTS